MRRPRYTIKVTSEDISNGHRGSMYKCPIALAVTRALEIDNYQIDVGPDGVFLPDNNDRFVRSSGHLPRAAKEFISKFDEGQSVEPITFRPAIGN